MLPNFSRVRLSFADLSIHRKGLLIITIPMVALILSTSLFSYAQWNENVAAGWLKHTLEVEKQIDRIDGTIQQAQSGARDQAVHDNRGLAQYQTAKKQLPEQLDGLEASTMDNPRQTTHVRTLRILVNDMLKRLDTLLTDPEQRPDMLSYRQWLEKNRLPVDEVHQRLGSMLIEEERLLGMRRAQRTAAQHIGNIAIVLSFLIGIVGTLITTRFFSVGISQRIRLLEENAHLLRQGIPLPPAPHGNDEIGRLGTAIQEANGLLVERSDRLKLALKTARIVVWEMDPSSGRIRYEGRDEFIESANYPAAFLPSTRDAFFKLIDPTERAGVEQEFDKTLSSGAAFQRECHLNGSDHSEGWVSVTARQYSRAQNSSTVLGVIMDVAARKSSEQIALQQAEALAKSEQHLREQTRILQTVVNSMGHGVVVADKNGAFLLFNPAAERILGVGAVKGAPDEWTHQFGVFSADQVTPCPASEVPLARALRGISVDREELFIRNAVISEGAWISITASPLKDELGAIWGGVVVFADITERKRVDQALHVAKDDAERANRAKSEFLSRMSHELRTPLNSILGFSQILKMHDLPERPRECVEHVMKGGTHLLGLIDEVLDIARIEAGRLALSPEPVLASDSVHQVLDMVRPLAAARNITLTFDRPRSCQQHILADRQRLHQVLLNLLSNAVKYNHDGGRVDISCNKSPDRQLRLSVRDTGAGISEADQARLFAPFERLAANDSEVQGTGLGLALSKRLMEAMGGKIGLESLPGDGSTFWIELPHAEAPEDAVHRQEMLSMIGIKHIQGTRTVLYIEDNLSNMRLMEHIVSYRPQISLVPAMQGRLGLELAYQHRPDLILLDLHLPDLSGDEVLKRLQADPRTRGIPVVMISADATPGQVNRLLGAGAAAYLTKPLNVENLLKVFDDHLAEFAGTDFVAATNERKS